MRVLIAEGDHMLAELLGELLADEGFTVRHVSTLAATRHALEAAAWDVCLFDLLDDPRSDPSPEHRATLRALSARAPLILATWQPWARRVPPAELGVAAILPKPYDLAELVETVRSVGCEGPHQPPR